MTEIIILSIGGWLLRLALLCMLFISIYEAVKAVNKATQGSFEDDSMEMGMLGLVIPKAAWLYIAPTALLICLLILLAVYTNGGKGTGYTIDRKSSNK